MPNVNTLSVR